MMNFLTERDEERHLSPVSSGLMNYMHIIFKEENADVWVNSGRVRLRIEFGRILVSRTPPKPREFGAYAGSGLA
jgi:hypothetical protein